MKDRTLNVPFATGNDSSDCPGSDLGGLKAVCAGAEAPSRGGPGGLLGLGDWYPVHARE